MDETIQKMVNELEPGFIEGLRSFALLKRPLSSSSKDSSQGEGTPLKKLKLESKLNYVGSPREYRRMRADLLEARHNIIKLEERIMQMHNVRKEMELMYENETQLLKKQREHDRKAVADLETQLHSVRQREFAIKNELSDLKNKHKMLKVVRDNEVEELEKSLTEMKEESRLFDGEESVEIVALNRRIAELQMLLDAAEEDAEAQKNLVGQLQSLLSEKSCEERDLEVKTQALQAAKIRISELENAKENFLEFQDQAKTQINKLVHYTSLEKEVELLREENARIRNEIKNKLILEEEVHNLKTKMKGLKEMEKSYSAVETEKIQNERYLDEWRAVARCICESTDSDASLPHLLRKSVERLQQQEITLTSAKVELESQLTSAQYEAKLAKTELDKMKKHLIDIKKGEEQRQILFHRIQKKLTLVSRERDSYRQQLDAYEKDLTVNIVANAAQQTQRDRIENLERILDNYRELNAKLENDLQNATPGLVSDAGKEEQIRKLQQELDRARAENDKLLQRKDQLEIQLDKFSLGNDSLRGGAQILHLAKNPLKESRTEHETQLMRIQEENARLKRKIKNLESGLEASKLNESSTVSSKEIQELKEKLKVQEIHAEKVREHYVSSMQGFRNVVYMLFGYKIDRKSSSCYKLSSMYADRESDQLCFQVIEEGGDGTLNLMENQYSATLEQMINLHLKHQKSIPVFLSALTLDLFNNSTIATKTFVIDD